jgi:hypothetical protein
MSCAGGAGNYRTVSGEWSTGAQGAGSSARRLPFAGPLHSVIRPTLRISCEAVPPSVRPAGAQGGTSACRTGAALSFVSFIRLLGGFLAPSSLSCVAQSVVQERRPSLRVAHRAGPLPVRSQA